MGRRKAPAFLIPPTTHHRPPTTDHRPPTTDHRPPTTGHFTDTRVTCAYVDSLPTIGSLSTYSPCHAPLLVPPSCSPARSTCSSCRRSPCSPCTATRSRSISAASPTAS